MHSCSVAVTTTRPKSAALLFDKVFCLGEACPSEVRLDWRPANFGLPERMEVPIDLVFHPDGRITGSVHDPRTGIPLESGQLQPQDALERVLTQVRNLSIDVVAAHITQTTKHRACPIYESDETFSADYAPGDYQALLGVIEGIALVREECLEWSQVLEFRRDAVVVKQYRRLLHWLDSSLVGRSEQFIEDEIATRLAEYDRAIAKHGLQTLLGSISDLLDPKLITGLAAAGAAASLHSAMLALGLTGGIAVGSVMVKAIQRGVDHLDTRNDQAGPIAYIISARDQFS